jgi:hypothetical protein
MSYVTVEVKRGNCSVQLKFHAGTSAFVVTKELTDGGYGPGILRDREGVPVPNESHEALRCEQYTYDVISRAGTDFPLLTFTLFVFQSSCLIDYTRCMYRRR